MHNPFAIAVQWPDDPRRYLIHLQRPYFTAALYETPSAAWLAVSWSPNTQITDVDRGRVFRAAADTCRNELAQIHIPIEFVERKQGYHLPRFLMAQSAGKDLFIVEPDHSTPLVEVREGQRTLDKSNQQSHRHDVITQWRLGQMRQYYREFLERQNQAGTTAFQAKALSVEKK